MAESIREIQPAFEGFRPLPEGLNPSLREWGLHGSLFIITIITTTIAGTMLAAPELPVADPRLSGLLDYLLYVPIAYLRSAQALFSYAATHPGLLIQGLTFSATLPFFIPAPPLFLAGTFGAFIKIRSPIPSRRALFDIGLAGPLAGFVVALPLSLIGVLTIQSPLSHEGPGIVFNDPLLFRLLARAVGVTLDPNSPINPYYMAAWIGLLVTSLNLMPVGQLDGGHGTFAVFGQRAHEIIGRVAFVTVAVLAVLGWFWHGSPSGFLYAVLLGVMLKVRHPQPAMMEPLGTKRVLIAILTLIVFALCFWPFPITIT